MRGIESLEDELAALVNAQELTVRDQELRDLIAGVRYLAPDHNSAARDLLGRALAESA
ncbi:MAG: hypothetical protein ACJ8FS_17160 [Sphingomicrobium sp.]|jgi:hypothetical protein